MFRRFVIILGAGLGLGLAALFVFRTTAVEALIVNALTERGVAVAGLSVTRLGMEDIHIADLRLGETDELNVRSLRVYYQPRAPRRPDSFACPPVTALAVPHRSILRKWPILSTVELAGPCSASVPIRRFDGSTFRIGTPTL